MSLLFLSYVSREYSELKNKYDALEKEKNFIQNNNTLLTQEKEDLGKQLRHLLRQQICSTYNVYWPRMKLLCRFQNQRFPMSPFR